MICSSSHVGTFSQSKSARGLVSGSGLTLCHCRALSRVPSNEGTRPLLLRRLLPVLPRASSLPCYVFVHKFH